MLTKKSHAGTGLAMFAVLCPPLPSESLARFTGAPTHLVFDISHEGELTRRFALKITGPINGAALID